MQPKDPRFCHGFGEALVELGRTICGEPWADRLAGRFAPYAPRVEQPSADDLIGWFADTTTMPNWTLSALAAVINEQARANALGRAALESHRLELGSAINRLSELARPARRPRPNAVRPQSVSFPCVGAQRYRPVAAKVDKPRHAAAGPDLRVIKTGGIDE